MPNGLPWVHLDLLGPSWNEDAPRDYTPAGATGAGVRTILAAVEDTIAACRKGPTIARVESIDAREASADELALRGDKDRFAVLPTV